MRVWGCLARADFTLCQQLDFTFKTRTRSPLTDCRSALSLGYSLATAASPVVLIAISALRSATSLSSLPYFYPRQPSNSSQKAPLQSLSGRCLRSPTITSRFTHCFKPQPESSRFAASSNWRPTNFRTHILHSLARSPHSLTFVILPNQVPKAPSAPLHIFPTYSSVLLTLHVQS